MLRIRIYPFFTATMLAIFFLTAGLPNAAPALSSARVPAKISESTNTAPEWDQLVADAKKEGAVNIYGTALAPAVNSLSQAFKKKYDIRLEFVQGRPSEVMAKLDAERNAGLFLADVAHMGDTSTLMDIIPAGVTTSLENLLVLAEVKNPQNWLTGKLPFADKDHHSIAFMGQAVPYGLFNSDMVKQGEINSFLDLLQPKWREKIIFNDPSISGPGPNLMAALFKVFGREKAQEIFRKLAAQKPIITRDNRLLMEWVARGKYPVCLGPSMSLFADFQKAGAPLRVMNLREPRYVGSGNGNIVIFNKNPHPKAAQVYLNWLLSKEGSLIWQSAMKYSSRRVDVPKDGLEREGIPRSEDFFPDEEHLRLRVEMRNTSSNLFQ